jgi:hypothetical protein
MATHERSEATHERSEATHERSEATRAIVLVGLCSYVLLSAPAWAQDKLSPSDTIALKEYLSQVITERDRQYAQRFEAQQKAVDAALVAQDKATSAAFAAAKEAVAAALAAQERATNAAFTAANSAVSKAETANEKRLDSVNEFRSQLKDQASNFVTRTELLSTIVGFGGLLLAILTFARYRTIHSPEVSNANQR